MLVLETNSTTTTTSAAATTTSQIVTDSPTTTTTTTMLTNGSNQYIQPDYLSPLPTTLDAKRSPLALLAQTCSQIGADPTPTPTSTTSTSSSSSSISVTKSMADKPSKKSESNENNKSNNRKTPPTSSSSTTTKHQQSSTTTMYDPYGRRDDLTGRSGESEHHHTSKSGFKSPSASSGSKSGNTTSSPTTTSISSAYPSSLSEASNKLTDAQRAALEAMQQQQSHLSKDIQSLGAYRPSPVFPSLSGLSGLSPYHHPGLAGLDAATAAALGAFRHPAYSAAAHLGYPPVSLGLSLASYQQALNAASYGRLGKSPADSMSVCRDPYCTGCPSSVLAASHSAAAAAQAAQTVTSSSSSPSITTSNASSCPAGCTQCDHIRTTSSNNNGSLGIGSSITSSAQSSNLSTVSSTPSTIVTSTASPPDAASVASRPYVCNWIAADHYCGKRFTSSEELLQHLRTHTSLSVPVPTAVSAPSEPLSSPLGSSSYSPLLNPSLHPHSHLLAASSALHRTYPTPPLSPLSMARYHPYSKPPTSASPLSAAASIPPPPPNPLLSLHHPYAGLGAYYSTHPYSLYSQRMLAGAGVLP